MGKKIGVALLALLASANLYAADLKVGVVDIRKLIEQSSQRQKAQSDLQKEFAPRDKKLVAEQKDIKQLEEKLEKDATVMGDSERNDLEKKIIDRRREAKRLLDEFREDYNRRVNDEMMKLQKLVAEAIQSVAKEQNFDLVLVEGVAFATDSLNITDQVEKKLGQSKK